MYFTGFYPYAAGPFSLMDQSPHNPPHLDPFHKLKLGWVKPVVVNSTGWYVIPDVETNHEVLILCSPKRKNKEYFIIENRWRTSYDRCLPDCGIAIWHIIEDLEIIRRLEPPPGVLPKVWPAPHDQIRRAVRLLRPNYGPPIRWQMALWDRTSTATATNHRPNNRARKQVALTWADGTSTGFSICAIPSASRKMRIRIEVED
jgi:hypothetical protein